MSFVLWLIAAILVIAGIVVLLQGSIIFGILLIIAGCLVGPGGYGRAGLCGRLPGWPIQHWSRRAVGPGWVGRGSGRDL